LVKLDETNAALSPEDLLVVKLRRDGQEIWSFVAR
jgi:hypothetical protein